MQREASPWLPLLQEALLESRVLHLRYHSYSPDRVTERKVEPYQLVYYDNDWHLVGYCRLREGMRDFRAGRILAAEVLPEAFRRHPAVASEAQHEDWSDFREVRVAGSIGRALGARETGFGLDREEQAEVDRVYVPCGTCRLMPWLLSRSLGRVVASRGCSAVREQAESMVQRYVGE
jgi:predicted DNA-binding transcriptional regulator YafY